MIIIQVLRKLIYELFFHKPDLIYFQISPKGIAFYRDLIYVTIIKIFGVDLIYHLHGKGIIHDADRFIDKKLYKYSFKNSDIICLSYTLTGDIKNVYNKKPYVVANGIPDENIAGNIKKTSGNIIKLLFLSNLIKTKGIIEFLDTIELIVYSKRKKIKAFIVGGEADFNKDQLIAEIKKRKLSDVVEYLGPLYGDEKFKLLLDIDILIYPSKNDAFPTVILESFMFGKPVVATKEGAIPEIIDDGETGFLVEKGDVSDLVNKAIHLIENESKRIEIGENCRNKFIASYKLEIFEKNMCHVFNNVLNN